MVRLRIVRSSRACESHRKKKVQASLGGPTGAQPGAGQVSAKLHTFTDGATFGSMEVYSGLGDLDRPGRTSSAQKSVIVFLTRSEWSIWTDNEEYSSLEAYLVWSGPRTTLQAFQGKLPCVDQKVVPALCASYEQFCDVFKAARSPKQPRAGILISPNECFLNTRKCMLLSLDLDTTEYNSSRPAMRTNTCRSFVGRI